jgi:hypothetical protein
MPHKEVAENLWPADHRIETSLYGSVATAFASPARQTQHRHPPTQAQHRLHDPAQTSQFGFWKFSLYITYLFLAKVLMAITSSKSQITTQIRFHLFGHMMEKLLSLSQIEIIALVNLYFML